MHPPWPDNHSFELYFENGSTLAMDRRLATAIP
jgi:hypothetical protein